VNSQRARNLADCLITQWGPHSNSHRTGYCDHHHGEYVRAKRRWQSAINNYRRGQTPNDPGPWDTLNPNIEFTPQPEWTVILNAHTRNQLKNLANELSHDLDAFEENAIYQENLTRIWFAQVENKVIAMRQAADILQKLSQGQQPQLPDNPRASR